MNKPVMATIATLSLGLAVLFSLGGAAAEQEAERTRPEVLVLGVYHMANPGRDVVNTESDDVLSPQRQSEIEEVVATLARFRPSKVAVEASFSSGRIAERYAEYLAGEHELTRNETEQIGYRLARLLGHETVYPVDVHGEFPYPRLVKYMSATGRAAEFEARQAEASRSAEALSSYMASHTVLETLLRMNLDEASAKGMAGYFRMAALGEPWDWAGADLVSDWFRRNMRIYTNIADLVDSPSERVLVVYGAGHLGWLRQALDRNPDFRLRKLEEFVR